MKKSSEHFQSLSDQLRVKPSSSAWRKLENKLDKKNLNTNTGPSIFGNRSFTYLAIAASLLLLLGVFSMFIKTDAEGLNHSLSYQNSPLVLEDLSASPNALVFSNKTWKEYQTLVHSRQNGSIKEGGNHKRLVVQQ